jgi:hypothetical protein
MYVDFFYAIAKWISRSLSAGTPTFGPASEPLSPASSTSDFFLNHPLPTPDFERIRATLEDARARIKTPPLPPSVGPDLSPPFRASPDPSPPPDLSLPEWSEPPVLTLPPRVRRLIAAANELLHAPRGNEAAAREAAPQPKARQRAFTQSSDSLDHFLTPPVLSPKGGLHSARSTGSPFPGPPQSLRSLRTPSTPPKPSLNPPGYPASGSDPESRSNEAGTTDPPEQGPESGGPGSPPDSDSPISSALFGSNPVQSSNQSSPVHSLDPDAHQFQELSRPSNPPKVIRAGFFHTVDVIDPAVFTLTFPEAGFESQPAAGKRNNPGASLSENGETANGAQYNPQPKTDKASVGGPNEAPLTKRLEIPDTYRKSLQIPFIRTKELNPPMRRLHSRATSASAILLNPKPLKPPHSPAIPSLYTHRPLKPTMRVQPSRLANGSSVLNRAPSKSLHLKSLQIPPKTPSSQSYNPDPPSESQPVSTPGSSAASGTPDSTMYPPGELEKDWFDVDLDLLKQQEALPRIRTRRRRTRLDQVRLRVSG